jgi:hypothetical protein
MRLGDFSAKKLVSYECRNVTFFIDYKDYLESLKVSRKGYKPRLMESIIKRRSKIESPSSSKRELRWKLIDSVYQTIKKLSKQQDTIYLSQKIFDNVGLRPLIDLDILIENKQCAIYHNGIRQNAVIRKKGYWYINPKNAWGGRRYFILGEKEFFYDATDWIS